ncbi:MAG: GAF domain-containing sensor histidine kinase [Acidimicrobiales bacterium]
MRKAQGPRPLRRGLRTANSPAEYLAGFHPPLTAIRWGAIAVGAALAASDETGWDTAMIGALGALVAYAGWRTWRPITIDSPTRPRTLVAGEVLVASLVLVATGYWQSPFVFSLITALGITGFVAGFRFALRLAIVGALGVTAPFLLDPAVPSSGVLRLSAQWAIELVLVAAIAGYARRISGEADVRHSQALDEVGRLTKANHLLTSLHEVAQDLPASLDLEQVLDATVERLRSFWDLSALAILVPDETSDQWLVARQEGVRFPMLLTADALPPALRQAAESRVGVTYPLLRSDDEAPGLSAASGSGVYAPLYARGKLVGLAAAEQREAGRFGPADVDLLDGFMVTAALAIDNARWFSRLRTVGADAERTRIARELHDRVGQSLASIGFELDRLAKHSGDDELRPGLVHLRGDLREAMGQIRDTLYDLRTEVSESHAIVETLEGFLERVERRSGAKVELRASGGELRLPLLQEREMWRVAQEAITNAERHGRPKEIDVWWYCDGVRAELEVVDDGCGFDPAAVRSSGSYGTMGMRERAASIGAALSIDSAPGRGTRVRCSLGAS